MTGKVNQQRLLAKTWTVSLSSVSRAPVSMCCPCVGLLVCPKNEKKGKTSKFDIAQKNISRTKNYLVQTLLPNFIWKKTRKAKNPLKRKN